MRYLVLLVLLSSCYDPLKPSPKFKVGDCVQYQMQRPEAWDVPFKIEKILEIGNYSYKTAYYLETYGNYYINSIGVSFYSQSNYNLVTCPK